MDIVRAKKKMRVSFIDRFGNKQIGTISDINKKRNEITIRNATGKSTMPIGEVQEFDLDKTLLKF